MRAITLFILPLILLVGCGEEIQNKVEQAKAKDDPNVPLLIPCEACKEGVAKKTDKCPKCGHPTADSVVAYKKAVEAEKVRREVQRKFMEEQMRLAAIEEERARKQAEIVAEQERQRKLAKQARTKAAYKKLGDKFTIPNLNLQMIWVNSGSFMMGDDQLHRVTLTNGFYLGKYEVTQTQYEVVMNDNPSQFKRYKRPVESVNWSDAVDFCDKLTEIERKVGRLPEGMVYALPTEAQWEYACRAGTTTSYSWGDTFSASDANYKSTIGQTTDVGSYRANPWGFFDMHGNVSEWTGPTAGLRGGSWADRPHYMGSAVRLDSYRYKRSGIGFRICFKHQ